MGPNRRRIAIIHDIIPGYCLDERIRKWGQEFDGVQPSRPDDSDQAEWFDEG